MQVILVILLGCTSSDSFEEVLSQEAVNDEQLATEVLRHMTQSQYNNTVKDLFNPYVLPTTGWLNVTIDGFYDRDSDIFSPTPALVDGIHQSSLQIVESLLEQGYFNHCDNIECGQAFVLTHAQQFWRRPLTDEEVQIITNNLNDWSEDSIQIMMALGIQYLLESPFFFYFPEINSSESLTDWEIASRMSYFLWDTMPDQELFDLAEQGLLQDVSVIEEQAWRMLADPKMQKGWLHFYLQWLKIDKVNQQIINLDMVSFYPTNDLNAEYIHYILQPQMRQQMELFFLKNILEGEGTVTELLTSSTYYLSEQLAPLYDVSPPFDVPGIDYQSVINPTKTETGDSATLYTGTYYPTELSALGNRSGFATMIGWLHATSQPSHPSVVDRGLFVIENLLCQSIDEAPLEVSLDDNQSDEPQTNRDRYAQHSSDPSCSGCHTRIDGIGFSFEHYDIFGRYQELDNGYPIDSSGQLVLTDVDGQIDDAIHLMEKLANSRMVFDCISENWYEYAVARQIDESDQSSLHNIKEQFWREGGHIPSLLVYIITSPAFLPGINR
jgi:hypothetical protein